MNGQRKGGEWSRREGGRDKERAIAKERCPTDKDISTARILFTGVVLLHVVCLLFIHMMCHCNRLFNSPSKHYHTPWIPKILYFFIGAERQFAKHFRKFWAKNEALLSNHQNLQSICIHGVLWLDCRECRCAAKISHLKWSNYKARSEWASTQNNH